MHVHITHNGKVIGTIGVHEDGTLWDDGTPAAHNAIHTINHGLDPTKHGPEILKAVVEHLDRSTYMSAHRCDKRH